MGMQCCSNVRISLSLMLAGNLLRYNVSETRQSLGSSDSSLGLLWLLLLVLLPLLPWLRIKLGLRFGGNLITGVYTAIDLYIANQKQ